MATPSTESWWCLWMKRTFAVGSTSALEGMEIMVTIAVQSWLPVTSSSPKVSRQLIPAWWKVPAPLASARLIRQLPFLGLHTRADPSSDAVITSFPSWLNFPHVTDPLCPLNTDMQSPVPAFHIHTDISVLPAMSTSPLLCQLIHMISSDGPSSVRSKDPSTGFHIFTTPSIPAVASIVPATLNATPMTESVCPDSEKSLCFDSLFHKPAVSSPPPVAISSDAPGCTATAYTASV
mmetsp:Transcript_6957/g.13790  ORF Transcript_6957/g.13790 Transcript_6957/m.13790 type:complete len:235 (-) Transcript_6957:275-979(-)